MKNKFFKVILTAIVFGSITVFMIFSRDFFAVFATMGLIAPIYNFGFYISAIMLAIFLLSFIMFWIVVLRSKKLKTKLYLFVLPITLLYISSILGFTNMNLLNNTMGTQVNRMGVNAIAGATGMSINTIMVIIISGIYLALLFLIFTLLLSPIKKVQKAVITLAKGNIDNEIKIGSGEEIKVIEKGLIKISSNLKNNKMMFEKLNNEYEKYVPTQFMKQLGKKMLWSFLLAPTFIKKLQPFLWTLKILQKQVLL